MIASVWTVDGVLLIDLEDELVIAGQELPAVDSPAVELPRVVATARSGSTIAAVVDRRPPLAISRDNGATWSNQRRAFLATPPDATQGSLNAISVVPTLDLAYVTALIPNPGGGTAVSSFWTVGLTQPWSPD